MSKQRLKRRRFLADLLFAGSAAAGAGLVTRWAVAQKPDDPKPGVTPTPSESPRPRGEPGPPQIEGDVMAPRTPSPTPTPPPPPAGGAPKAKP